MVYGDYRNDHPISEIVHAGRAPARLMLRPSRGPVAGFFAAEEKPPLVVTVDRRQVRRRALPMTFSTSRWGCGRADKAAQGSRWMSALSSLAPQIATYLAAYRVPVAWDATADR